MTKDLPALTAWEKLESLGATKRHDETGEDPGLEPLCELAMAELGLCDELNLIAQRLKDLQAACPHPHSVTDHRDSPTKRCRYIYCAHCGLRMGEALRQALAAKESA